MDSKEAEELNTETEEGTIALHKKRSRRVSFAEITSVHVFDRDEDYETPPESKPSFLDDNQESAQKNEVLGYFSDLADSDDSKDLSPDDFADENDDDDGVADGRKSFLRPIESPSPGSTIGSATSNDDADNFFGPVSASFIRPGRLSDSAASDDNLDVTMDSTAFSMHFHSLARSESGGDVRTPTGVRLAFEDKTATQRTTPTELGSFMVLTGAKKPILQSPAPVEKISGGKDSNDMSLVGENPHRYDYARLSPRLDALLAEGSKDLLATSAADPTSTPKSPSFPDKVGVVSKNSKNWSGPMYLKDAGDTELGNHGALDWSSVTRIKLSKASGNSTNIDEITYLSDVNVSPVVDASTYHQAQTHNQLTRGIPFGQRKESFEEAFETIRMNLEPSDINSRSLSYVDSRVHLSNISVPGESGYLPSTGGWIEEDNPEEGRYRTIIHHNLEQPYQSPFSGSKSNGSGDGRHNSDAGQNSKLKYRSPFGGSISLQSAKQRKVFLDTVTSPRHTGAATPEKRPGSILNEESLKRSRSASSIQKSFSKFNILGASPSISPFKDGNENLRTSLPDFLSMAPSFDGNSRDPRSKHVDAPVARLEEYFLNSDQMRLEHGSVINKDRNGTESSPNIKKLNQAEDTTDKFSSSEAIVISPSHFTLSGMKVPQHIFVQENVKGGTLITSRTDFSSIEIATHHDKVKKATNSPKKFVSSQVKMSKELSTSPEREGNLPSASRKLNYSNKSDSIGSEQDGDSMEIANGGSQLTAPQKMDFFIMEGKVKSKSPLSETKSSVDYTQVDRKGRTEMNFHSPQKDSETHTNLRIPPRRVETLNFQLGTPNGNRQTVTDLSRFKNEPTGIGIKASRSSDSPYSPRKLTNKPALEKEIQSPSTKEPCNVSHNDNLHLSVENSSGKKRRSEEMILGDVDQMDEIARTKKSPKVQKVGGSDMEFLLDSSSEYNVETTRIGGDLLLKHWSDIFTNFAAEIKHLHSPLVDKLNLRMIGLLEEFLVHQQKIKKYEMLRSDIHTQEKSDQNKRAFETKSLLCRLIHEQAKLPLLCMKHEKLRKKADLLSYGIQESQTLKMNYIQDLSVPSASKTSADDSHQGKHKIVHGKVATMRQEVEVLERKIKHLTKSFHGLSKVKGELSCTGTAVLLNDLLKKRSRCRFIREDLQPWLVDNLESRNGHHNIVVNYQGFVLQRFRVGGQASSISVSNELNEINIVTKFSNMDACNVFAFVLKNGNTRKHVDLRSLAQETQMISSLLCNLVDVIEEVRLARVELPNLTETRFYSPSVEQLDLRLCFTDFKRGEKIILTLDMTCLNCGVYPAEIIPYQLQAPQSLLAETRAAVESLAVGYSRIIRLSRCVSEMLQASTS